MTAAQGAIARQLERTRETGQTHWVAVVEDRQVEDGLDWLSLAGTRDRFYWEDLTAEHLCVAMGVSDEIESSGPSRFADVEAFRRSVQSRIEWVGASRKPTQVSIVGGFGYGEGHSDSADWKAFPSARFFLPEILIERSSNGSQSVMFVRVEPGATVESVEASRSKLADALRGPVPGDSVASAGFEVGQRASANPSREFDGPEYRVRSDRSLETFRAQVRQAVAAFEEAARSPETEGGLEKVVLARSLSVEHDADLDVVGFLRRLRALYPTCTLVAMGRGQDTFLAATPETLVRVEDRLVRTAALAGSAPRGRTPEEDSELGDELLSSEKERAEHAYVVNAIRDELALHCDSLSDAKPPELRKLFGIQHLETMISGELKAGDDRPAILELAAALHPTPAVGGAPRAASAAWLREYEALDRGWYAAPIGWLDALGGGNLRVALRSGLIRNGLAAAGRSGASRALLFAGAGLVAGSDAEQELVETRIKLRALLAPLTEI